MFGGAQLCSFLWKTSQLSFRNFLGDHLPSSLQWSLSPWVSCNLNFRCFLDGRLLHHPVRHHLVAQRHLDHLPPQLRHCGIENELKAAPTMPLVPHLRPHIQQWCEPLGGWHFLVVSRGKVLCASRLGAGGGGEGGSRTWPCTSTRPPPLPGPCRLLALCAVVQRLGKGHRDCQPLNTQK